MKIKLGTRVSTPNGHGTVVTNEYYNRLDGGTYRTGIKLDNNPFFYEPAYYWPKEISIISDEAIS